MWLQRLPPTVQAVLDTSSEHIERLAALADSMLDITDLIAIQSISGNQNKVYNDLVNVVDRLDGKIEALSKDLHESRKNNRQALRNRTRSPARTHSVTKKQFCFYHQRFGKKAKKCEKPCSFKPFRSIKAVNRSNCVKTDQSPQINRLFVTDKSSGKDFLIDTGADVSVLPPNYREKGHPP